MKKALAIVLAALYITVTSGIILSIHYCMGEVAGIAVGAKTSPTCGTCGMDNKGCCHDELQIVKLTDNHQAVSMYTDLAKAFAVMVTPAYIHHITLKQARPKSADQAHAPPPIYCRNILYCVYRI